VFTDVQMPGRMDGIQLSHYIHDRWPTVKLLVTSGATDVDASMLPPGSHFLSKPYAEELVVSEVAHLLGDKG
jgi:FixJ family two-component response regulator